jgi:glutathione S-transferase
VLETIDNWAQKFEKLRGDHRFTICDEPTYVDFIVAETIPFYTLLDDGLEVRHPKLVEFMNNMKALPNIQDYFTKAGQLFFFARLMPWANDQYNAGKPY